MSQPFFAKAGLAINQEVYISECLEKCLLPFIRAHHADDQYIFWPDKASSHYARAAINFMNAQGIKFVPKDHNLTNLPQCRPIEDLWGYLVTIVYKNGWRAETIKQLKRRV